MNTRTSTFTHGGNPKTVLIAESDPAARASFRRAFDSAAYEVHESDDGAEALGKALCHKPRLIIADTQLRRIDGPDLCRLLRADPATRQTAIIMLASTQSENERVRNAGADHVLDKSSSLQAVMTAARQLLDRDERGLAAERPPTAEGALGLRPGQRGFGIRSVRREQTTSPPNAPPQLFCPACQAPLVYQHSHIGGVNPRAAEQWDYLLCPSCGPYQYRHRTRRLRAT